MALFIWFYLAVLAAYLLIKSIVHQKRVKEREREILRSMEMQENRIVSDYKMLSKQLSEIKGH